MVDLGAIVAKKAVDVAVEGAKAAIERAKARDKEDVHTMLEYIEAARLAVWGLGQEREEILSDAALCDLNDQKRVEDLANRIDKYLRTNRLRPELERAIEGLGDCHRLIEQRSEKIMHWPLWGRGDQKATLEEVSSWLSELIRFLNSLGNRIQYLDASGIGAVELQEVERALKQRALHPGEAGVRLAETVNAARNNRSNREWLDMTLQAEGIAIRLRSAFG